MCKTFESEIKTLLLQCQTGSLATTGKTGPEVSMAPFALHQGHIILHLSKLARHTANISDHPKVGFMICKPESAVDSPLSLPRISLQGSMAAVPDNEYATVKSVYIEAIPDAEPLFAFSDFRLFRLKPSFIYWVGGFASARTVAAGNWHNILAQLEKKS